MKEESKEEGFSKKYEELKRRVKKLGSEKDEE